MVISTNDNYDRARLFLNDLPPLNDYAPENQDREAFFSLPLAYRLSRITSPGGFFTDWTDDVEKNQAFARSLLSEISGDLQVLRRLEKELGKKIKAADIVTFTTSLVGCLIVGRGLIGIFLAVVSQQLEVIFAWLLIILFVLYLWEAFVAPRLVFLRGAFSYQTHIVQTAIAALGDQPIPESQFD